MPPVYFNTRLLLTANNREKNRLLQIKQSKDTKLGLKFFMITRAKIVMIRFLLQKFPGILSFYAITCKFIEKVQKVACRGS